MSGVYDGRRGFFKRGGPPEREDGRWEERDGSVVSGSYEGYPLVERNDFCLSILEGVDCREAR